MSIELISFDMSGTLIDDLKFHNIVWHERLPAFYALRHGLEIREAKRRVEDSYQEFSERERQWTDLQYWVKRFGLEEMSPVEALLQDGKPYLRLYNEVYSALNKLKGRRLIVITEASKPFLDFELKGIEEHFDWTFSTVDDLGKVLKVPLAYKVVCEKTGVSPERMIHVGNNFKRDYIAAANAGVRALFLDRNYAANSPAPKEDTIHTLLGVLPFLE